MYYSLNCNQQHAVFFIRTEIPLKQVLTSMFFSFLLGNFYQIYYGLPVIWTQEGLRALFPGDSEITKETHGILKV